MNGTAPDTCFTHLENREADIGIALMSERSRCEKNKGIG